MQEWRITRPCAQAIATLVRSDGSSQSVTISCLEGSGLASAARFYAEVWAEIGDLEAAECHGVTTHKMIVID